MSSRQGGLVLQYLMGTREMLIVHRRSLPLGHLLEFIWGCTVSIYVSKQLCITVVEQLVFYGCEAFFKAYGSGRTEKFR